MNARGVEPSVSNTPHQVSDCQNVTKRGKPVAVLTPYPEEVPVPLFGRMKGRVTTTGDLTEPTGASWAAEK